MVAPPMCPICNKVMTFLYKDMVRRKSLYKCRTCGYREEEYDIDGAKRAEQTGWQNT